jgi:hypothetical protein
MAAVNITFPGNLAQVDTANDLRSIPTALIPEGTLYLVGGLEGVFTFDPGSMAVDDGAKAIRPYDRSPLQAGRWLKTANGMASGPAGPTGAASNTYTSYTALQASDPTRKYAYLAGDTDVVPRADGPYSNTTGVVGEWVPQGAAGVAANLGPNTVPATVQDALRGVTQANLGLYGIGGGKSIHLAAQQAFANGADQVVIPEGEYQTSGYVSAANGQVVQGQRGRTTVTTIADGGFALGAGVGGTIRGLNIHCAYVGNTYGPIIAINQGLIKDAVIEDINFSWEPGVLCNGITIVASNGIAGLTVQRIYAIGYPRMVCEFLNQIGSATTPSFNDLVVRQVVGEAPTGDWALGAYGSPNFTPVLSIDGEFKRATVEICCAIGSLGTAFELIKTDRTLMRAMRTVGCQGSLLASTNLTATNLTVDGWQDAGGGGGRTIWNLPSVDQAELHNLETPSGGIYTGPSPGIRIVNPRLSSGPATLTEPFYLIYSGGGGGGGNDLEIVGGLLDLRPTPTGAAIAAIQLDGGKTGQSMRGTRIARNGTGQGFVTGAGAASLLAVSPACVFQTGTTQSLTAS